MAAEINDFTAFELVCEMKLYKLTDSDSYTARMEMPGREGVTVTLPPGMFDVMQGIIAAGMNTGVIPTPEIIHGND